MISMTILSNQKLMLIALTIKKLLPLKLSLIFLGLQFIKLKLELILTLLLLKYAMLKSPDKKNLETPLKQIEIKPKKNLILKPPDGTHT